MCARVYEQQLLAASGPPSNSRTSIPNTILTNAIITATNSILNNAITIITNSITLMTNTASRLPSKRLIAQMGSHLASDSLQSTAHGGGGGGGVVHAMLDTSEDESLEEPQSMSVDAAECVSYCQLAAEVRGCVCVCV